MSLFNRQRAGWIPLKPVACEADVIHFLHLLFWEADDPLKGGAPVDCRVFRGSPA